MNFPTSKIFVALLALTIAAGCGKKEPEPQAKATPKIGPRAKAMQKTGPTGQNTPKAKSNPDAKNSEPTKATPNKLIADPIVERAVRRKINKPTNGLTEADFEKVTDLNLILSGITETGLKEVAK